jgi:hypothetical protein
MGKYTPPPVTFLDVLSHLPELAYPLSWRLAFSSVPKGHGSMHVMVELVYTLSSGHQAVYKRWGQSTRQDNTLNAMRAALVASQEAYLWADGKDVGELARFIAWNLGVPSPVG